ncbi:MAG: hypothetical protein IKG83_10810 [Prevotella sp.]|nr:hypothetical protein [Prevotella sp.]
MAKGNMLLGFSRGSVGDLTFYRRNSQQVTRARARVVKNPKTLAQQMQRAIMRTSVEAYKVIKEICDHSWEGVAYGANSYAEFQKQNMAMLRRLAAAGGEDTKSFVPSGFNGLVAMPWVLSKGSIAWGGVEIQFAQGTAGVNIVFNGYPSVSQIDTITYQQFCDFLNLRQSDQLTLIAFPKRSDIDESSCIEPIISRVILSSVSDSGMLSTMFDNDGKVDEGTANPLNENTDAFTFRFQTGKLMASIISAGTPAKEFVGAAAIISRRASDGSWLRSASIMTFNATEQSGGYTLRQASMVVANDITTASDWYLNNANEGSGE